MFAESLAHVVSRRSDAKGVQIMVDRHGCNLQATNDNSRKLRLFAHDCYCAADPPDKFAEIIFLAVDARRLFGLAPRLRTALVRCPQQVKTLVYPDGVASWIPNTMDTISCDPSTTRKGAECEEEAPALAITEASTLAPVHDQERPGKHLDAGYAMLILATVLASSGSKSKVTASHRSRS
jgi:hypothetical protein